jgi:2-oxoglutarate dehydrogenase E2 component (dihydrolipoamide succinyltransferase)
MVKEMKIPSPGESITEVEIASWLVENGEYVDVDQPIAEIDSDKATLELVAEFAGAITLIAEEGDAIEVGSVVCSIDTSIKGTSKAKTETKPVEKEEGVAEKTKEEAPKVEAKIDAKATPVAREMIKESGVKASSIKGSGANGRITKGDVEAYVSGGIDAAFAMQGWGGTRDESEKKMSMLRRKVAQRLVAVKQETAMLTTFNEIDMSFVMDLRKKHKEAFREKHGVNLGFMSFFTKACTEALRLFPSVNGMIDGDQVITYDYADIGIAVSSPKGLMVPVVRNAEQMSLAEIEAEIKRLAIKARDGKLAIDEMTGGTFTITNGGVFGSMMSTPIINPPQSAILGMHNIVERPIAVNGEVVIRPIMYIALSYDHRIIDGKESVSFLYKVKEMIENPLKLMFGSKSPEEVLLGL